MQAAADEALSLEGVIDVVVNNAGMGATGLTECFTIDQFREILDVNLLGAQRVNHAVLPAMRKRGSGLLVHISSIVGRLVSPTSCPYAATSSHWRPWLRAITMSLCPLGTVVGAGFFGQYVEANNKVGSDAVDAVIQR